MMRWFLTLLCILNILVGNPLWANAAASNLAAISNRTPTEQLDDLASKAFAATSAGDFAIAEAYWTEIINQFPDNAAAWSNRGNAKVSQNKLAEALTDYDKSVELAPSAPDPYLNRGTALEGMKRWQEAIEDYNRVLELDSQDAYAYNNRGNAKAGLGLWQESIEDFKTAANLGRDFTFARANYALALYQVGETEKSVREMKNILRKYPNFADVRAALTAVLWEQKKTGEAESNWVSAIGLDSRYRDLDWVENTRRWPPAITASLAKFLKFQS